jgi:hypothetical protein
MSITVACPSCGAKSSAPDNAAGRKVKCPKCQLVIPVPVDEAGAAEVHPVQSEEPRASSAPPRSSYEPAGSHRDEPVKEGDRRPGPRRGHFSCPFCGSDAPPREAMEISPNGMIVMVVLLLTCLPLFWIPLVSMKEPKRYCSDCGSKLGG